MDHLGVRSRRIVRRGLRAGRRRRAGAVAAPEAEPQDDTAPPAAPPPLPDDRTLYFTPESADLIPETRAKLDATATAIAEWATAGGDPARLTVTAIGHTALYDTEASRLELSRERARATAARLEAYRCDDSDPGPRRARTGHAL